MSAPLQHITIMNRPLLIRLDLLVQQQHGLTRTKAQQVIRQGEISINTIRATKPSQLVSVDTITTHHPAALTYVSRGGYKLAHALVNFAIDVQNAVALDVGISTGGFTDCLLQNGACRVYGVDTGTNQTVPAIKNDQRVMVYENINIKDLKPLPELVDIVVIDVSFVSVLKIIDSVIPLARPQASFIILIKPQFEQPKKTIYKNGVITDPAIHTATIERVCSGLRSAGLIYKAIIPSPIEGGSGNSEFLGYFIKKVK